MRSYWRISLFFTLFAAFCWFATSRAVEWSDQFHVTGPNNLTTCLTTWEGDLVVGGKFSAVGSVPANLVARQIGDQQWVGMGQGLEGLDIFDFVVFEGKLHALCQRTYSTMGIYALEGGLWTQLGVDLPTASMALAVYDGQLYAGGFLWDGGGWFEAFAPDGPVKSFIVFDDLLLVGGDFETINGATTGTVVAWDGIQILDVYPGQTETVNAFAIWHDELYLARQCRTGPSFDAGVQCWRDGAWTDILELGSIHAFRPYRDLIATADALLICGDDHPVIVKSTKDNRLGEAFIKSWDGSTVVEPYAVDDMVRFSAIHFHDDDLYLAGGFSTIGSPLCHHLGRVANNELHPICPAGLGANSSVNEFLPSTNGLVIGGYFSSIAGMVDQGVALYANGQWQSRSLALADFEDFQRMPVTMAWHEGNLSAMVTGHASLSMAYWNGMQWVIPQPWDWVTEVHELRSWNGILLGLAGNQILDYSSYMDPVVYLDLPDQSSAASTLIDDGDLIVGGRIPSLDGVSLNNVGRFDGGNWTALGEGLPEPVKMLGRYQGQIIAAFGPTDAVSIATWDGDTWRMLPLLLASRVVAMQEYRGHLFVSGVWRVGEFHYVYRFLYLEGDDWVPVGEIGGNVYALGVVDDELWVGGSFSTVDGVPSSNLASLTMEVTPVESDEEEAEVDLPSAIRLESPTPNPFNPMTVVSFSLAEASPVKLEVYNVRGQCVATLLNGPHDAGQHQVTWTGLDHHGQALPSGSYLLRLDTGREVRTTKATLVR